jgi:flagellar hook-basal body complex protein FliE
MTPAVAAKAYATAANANMQIQPGADKKAEGPDFGEMLGTAMANVIDSGHAAEKASMAGIAGKTDPVNVVTAVAETELALETMVSVRDKVISAYQDILRMPI